MPDQCLAKVLPRVFPRLHRIPVILGKWQRVPAVPLATAPYSRHVLDGSLHPDLLLCSLSIWLHFLALISMILIIWQFSLWQFLSLTSFSLQKNERKEQKAKIRIPPSLSEIIIVSILVVYTYRSIIHTYTHTHTHTHTLTHSLF